ncbi:MAG: TIGR01212 family radical SAM protein [Anaerococcus sp.]|nr:TIGR01212 family radical SAM protein [Anaerococcus sp.]
MEINKKRYNDLDSYFKRKFKKKILKLPLDGGFTCPNRDGTLSSKGCIYCSEEGSGEWTQKGSITDQLAYQKNILSKPGRKEAYMAYLQNFTATYGPIDKLKRIVKEALAFEGIEGIFIATRADCLSDEVLDFLADLNKKTFLVVELGMQSVNEKTISFINRGYTHKEFDQGLLKLKKLGIKVLVHIIIGLPWTGLGLPWMTCPAREDFGQASLPRGHHVDYGIEDLGDYLNDIAYINQRSLWGIKIHNLYVEEGSSLLPYFKKNPYTMTKDAYVEILGHMLRHLDPKVVINRLSGDGRKDKIIYPTWAKNKAAILSSLDKYLKENNYKQGDLWKS